MNTKMIPMGPMEILAKWDPERNAFVTVGWTSSSFSAERVWAQLGLSDVDLRYIGIDSEFQARALGWAYECVALPPFGYTVTEVEAARASVPFVDSRFLMPDGTTLEVRACNGCSRLTWQVPEGNLCDNCRYYAAAPGQGDEFRYKTLKDVEEPKPAFEYTFVTVSAGPRAFVSGDCMSGVEPATLADFLATLPEKP